jgi:hypothetical protein
MMGYVHQGLLLARCIAQLNRNFQVTYHFKQKIVLTLADLA